MLSNFHHGTHHGTNHGANHGTNHGNANNVNNVNLKPIQYLPYNSFYQHSFPLPIKHDLHSQLHSHSPIKKISINEINVFKKPEKRKRKKFNEVERFYNCNYHNCNKSYGTLNHLNSHIFLQNHGRKRLPHEFKEIRQKLKLKRKLERDRNREKERDRRTHQEKEQDRQKQLEKDREILTIGINNNSNNSMDAVNKILNPISYNNYYTNNNNSNSNSNSNSNNANTITNRNNNYFTHTPAHYANYSDYTNYINYTNSLYSPRNSNLSNLNVNLNYAFNLNNYKI